MTVNDRAHGIMNGIAVGNLLGITTEGWGRWDIREAHPQGIRNILARSGYPDDDDLAQSIVIAEAAAEGPLNADDLGRRFWIWAEANGAGIGGLTRHVLALYGGADPQRLARNRSAGHVREPRGLSILEASESAWEGYRAGNGALMRCAPLAIRWSQDPLRLVRESIVSSVPTHWDTRCGWSCAIANLAVAGALAGENRSANQLIGLAQEGVAAAFPELRSYDYEPEPPQAVMEVLREASESTLDDIDFDHDNRGFTLLGLQAALISYWQAPNFENGLRQIVEAGGDTDTNGAIVGAVLGARFGATGIPPSWRQRTLEIRLGRVPMEHYAETLIPGAPRRTHQSPAGLNSHC